MQEKIKGYLGKVAGWWKAAGKKVKLFLIAGLIAVVAVVAVVLAMQMNQPYTTLFTGLNQTELNEIVSYLSEQGMADYRIEGSDTILVPAEQEVRLKAALAQQGYPKSGFAYSMYLDHVGSLTTEGEREQLEQEYKDIQTELSPIHADAKKLWAIHYNIYEVQHEQERQNTATRQKRQEIEH